MEQDTEPREGTYTYEDLIYDCGTTAEQWGNTSFSINSAGSREYLYRKKRPNLACIDINFRQIEDLHMKDKSTKLLEDRKIYSQPSLRKNFFRHKRY